MEMDKLIERINTLARRAKTVGLTAEEAAEQASLRKEYIQIWRKSVQSQLDNIYFVDEKGNKQKLQKKKKS